MPSAGYLRAWRRAHPDRVKTHAATQAAKRKGTEQLAAWQKTSKRNEKRRAKRSRRQAELAGASWTTSEDALILTGRPARELAWETGRSVDAIYSRRAKLKRTRRTLTGPPGAEV